jgi:signal-transduction protein with cAMP-binding, CBS, and nucleotidyltransferase domain
MVHLGDFLSDSAESGSMILVRHSNSLNCPEVVPGYVTSGALPSIDVASLQPFCRAVRFAPGDRLREKGQHYADAYLIVDGSVSVDRKTNRSHEIRIAEAGSSIGEIEFVQGTSATLNVTARTETSALVLDARTLADLKQKQPEIADCGAFAASAYDRRR